MSHPPTARLLSVNTGTALGRLMEGRRVVTAIGKSAREGPIAVNPLGLAGDEQADPTVHGGLTKAVYAYPSEHLPFWQAERKAHNVPLAERALPFGFVGENLSISGLLEAEVWIGDELHFPDCTLRVTEPRQPCYKFNIVMGFTHASRRMAEAGCSGFYLSVTRPGTIEAGQTFMLHPGPRDMSVAQMFAGKRWKHVR
jgi:MOSC domain-containing protein YiiM